MIDFLTQNFGMIYNIDFLIVDYYWLKNLLCFFKINNYFFAFIRIKLEFMIESPGLDLISCAFGLAAGSTGHNFGYRCIVHVFPRAHIRYFEIVDHE